MRKRYTFDKAQLESAVREGWIWKSFSPYSSAISTILGIIGILLGVYFYLESRERPELTYSVSPVRTAVVNKGQISKLKVLFNGVETTADISAAQVAIWNDGKRPIRPENVRKAVTIKLQGNTPILEATIKKTNREVVQFVVDQSKLQVGEIGVSWNMLERNDGAVLQVIYAGSPGLGLSCEGIIESQGDVKEATRPNRIMSLAWFFVGGFMSSAVTVVLYFSISGVLPVPFAGNVRHTRASTARFVALLICISSVTFVMLEWLLGKAPSPPFGF